MPTARGWLTVATGVGLWAVGRIFGTPALEQIGFSLLVLVMAAAVVVGSRRHEVEVERTVAPSRARAGQVVDVRLTLRNEGRGSAPLMLLDDRVPLELAGHARFALNGIEPGGARETGYQIRPPRRGRYEVGPLNVSFVDPFALAQTRSQIAGVTPLLVHPRIEPLALPREFGQQRSMSVSALRQLTGARGEDFYTLRDYAEGDDLRKIHWPSTAKRGKPMIRQEETPWHTRATVLFDDRRAAHDGFGESSSFERCVEAAASLTDLYHRAGYTYRVMGVHNPGRPAARGTDHFHRCLDLLAVAADHPSREGDRPLLVKLTELESGTRAEGTLVVATAAIAAPEAVALTRCLRRFRQVVVAMFPAHRYGSASTRARWEGEQRVHETLVVLNRAGVRALVVGPEESLAAGWASLSNKDRRVVPGGI